LGGRVVGAQVLELFAGTGALSLECLSRGAARAVCVEKAERHARAIRQNLASVQAAPNALEVRVQDVFVALVQLVASARHFDLVLADPPYGEKNVNQRSRSLAQRLLDDANLPKVLSPGGLFVLGHTKRDTLEIPPAWQELKMLKHGDSIMRLLTAAEPQTQSDTIPAS
jgi:16S rRNA (guanine966-N2)-methyltransferase